MADPATWKISLPLTNLPRVEEQLMVFKGTVA
jgi:hypothetical protein